MKLGLDVDGVFADFNSCYQELLIEMSGRDLFGPNYIPTTWYYPQTVGYTQVEEDKVWAFIEQSPAFWQLLPAYPEAYQALNDCLGIADEVYFITSRPGRTAKAQTEYWLRWLSPMIVHPATVLIVSNLESKGFIARGLQLDAFLDDRWENCQSVVLTSPGTRVCLLNRPWNQGVTNDYIHRVTRIQEVLHA